MKIPDDIRIGKGALLNTGGPHNNLLVAWQNKALEIGIRHGIYVEVGLEYKDWPISLGDHKALQRIYFKALDREFETSTELLRMIRLKAFL
jgi:hypothetical protein